MAEDLEAEIAQFISLAVRALQRFLLTSESALGLAGVPPMVDTTASTSSIWPKAFSMSETDIASPRTKIAFMPSISDLQEPPAVDAQSVKRTACCILQDPLHCSICIQKRCAGYPFKKVDPLQELTRQAGSVHVEYRCMQ